MLIIDNIKPSSLLQSEEGCFFNTPSNKKIIATFGATIFLCRGWDSNELPEGIPSLRLAEVSLCETKAGFGRNSGGGFSTHPQIHKCAEGGIRTHTGNSQQILNLQRLPIPPPRQIHPYTKFGVGANKRGEKALLSC